GPSDLNVSSKTITGSNSGQFSVSSDTCTGGPITSRNSCTFGIEVSPTGALRPRPATFTFFDDLPPRRGGVRRPRLPPPTPHRPAQPPRPRPPAAHRGRRTPRPGPPDGRRPAAPRPAPSGGRRDPPPRAAQRPPRRGPVRLQVLERPAAPARRARPARDGHLR